MLCGCCLTLLGVLGGLVLSSPRCLQSSGLRGNWCCPPLAAATAVYKLRRGASGGLVAHTLGPRRRLVLAPSLRRGRGASLEGVQPLPARMHRLDLTSAYRPNCGLACRAARLQPTWPAQSCWSSGWGVGAQLSSCLLHMCHLSAHVVVAVGFVVPAIDMKAQGR